MRRPRCQRGAAGAARLPAAGSPPGRPLPSEGGLQGGPRCGESRARSRRWRGGGRWRPEGFAEAAGWGEARGRRGAGAQARVLPAPPKSTCSRFVLFLARYWEDFHSCTVTALTDCQEGAKDMWDKLRKESKNLNIQGSLFELCGSGNGAAGSLLPALPLLLVSLSAALATWLSF